MSKKNEYEYLDMRRARSNKYGSKQINSRKNNYNYNISGKNYSNKSNSNHVVVKITGGAKSINSMIRNFDYDTRQNTLVLYDKNGYEIGIDDAKKIALDDYQLTKVKNNKDSEPRRTYRLIFSMRGKLNEDVLKKAVFDTLTTHFNDHNFFYSLHPDTNNNHVHVTVMKKSIVNHKNLNINKSLLNKVKSQFAINLQMRGINAKFSSITDKQSDLEKESAKLERANKRKNANVYKVVDFGKANFDFDETKPLSFYLFMQTKNGKAKKMWNKGLEDAIKSAEVKIGDYIKIKEIKDENNQSFKVKKWTIEKVDIQNNKQEFIVNDFGIANYKFQITGKPSGFVKLIDNLGNENTIWSKQLNQLLNETNVQKGDNIVLGKDLNDNFIMAKNTNKKIVTNENEMEAK